jgi:hypothetical protein
LTLGPEQLAVVGCGDYARHAYDLGVQDDIAIPRSIDPLPADLHCDGSNSVSVTVMAPNARDIRILVRQTANGKPVRSSGGAPPNGTTMGRIIRLNANQGDRPLAVQINYDKALWSGLSWAVGEVDHRDLQPNQPVKLHCISLEKQPVDLHVQVYSVAYD